MKLFGIALVGSTGLALAAIALAQVTIELSKFAAKLAGVL
jgi:hypothetical protein